MSDEKFANICDAAVIIAIAICITLLCIFTPGCASHSPLTPAQVATTRPVTHVITNIQTVVYHSQQVLESTSWLAFIAAALGAGLAVLGLLEADHPLEHIGLAIAIIGGVVTVLSFSGVIFLPLAPWILLVAICGGAGYGAYLLFEKFHKKSPPPVAPELTKPQA